MLQVIVLLELLALAATAPGEQATGKLQFLSSTPEQLLVTYSRTPEEGVVIQSEIQDSHHHLSVATLSGEPLLSVTASSATSGPLHWKILGYNILLHQSSLKGEEVRMTEYIVPPLAASRVEREVKQNQISQRLLQLVQAMDDKETNATKVSAITQLMARPEMEAVIEVAKALGGAGIYGHESPAALNFYGVALNLAKLQNRETLLQQSLREWLEGSEASDSVEVEGRRSRRATCTRPGFWGTIRHRCSRCYSSIGTHCLGLCGYGCNCWRAVCGDCCYHQGCYEHDICCRNYGFWNFRCVLVFPFNCRGYRYRC